MTGYSIIEGRNEGSLRPGACRYTKGMVTDMNKKDAARTIVLWELIECSMAVSSKALHWKEKGGANPISTVSCMQTDEYKRALEKEEINNPKLASYIRESEEDFEKERYDFVEGLQDDDTGEHFLIFTWDALFVREEKAYKYI